MEGIISAPGAASSPAIPLRFPSRSPASARCAAPAATRTATIISAASSRCARSATSKARSSIDGVLALVDRHQPLHVSIVGGEPLVRYRELNTLLPALAARHPRAAGHQRRARNPRRMARHRRSCRSWCRSTACSRSTTSAARRRPTIGSSSTSPDTDHRALHGHPAAGEPPGLSRGVPRILVGAQEPVEKIWVSLYTPQIGEVSEERLRPADRERVIADLRALRLRYPNSPCRRR